MPSEISPICPVCGQLDAVRKVVSIVSEGISTTEYSMPTVWQWQGKIYSGVQRHTASSMSTLALRLLPPAPPEKKQVSLGWVILPFVVLWLLPIVGFPIFWLAPFLSSDRKAKLRRYFLYLVGTLFLTPALVIILALISDSSGSALILWYILFALGALLDLVLANVGLFGTLIVYYKGLIEANKEMSLKYEKDFSQWKIKIEKYQNLYYCARDDCVFDPNTRLYSPAVEMSQLLG